MDSATDDTSGTDRLQGTTHIQWIHPAPPSPEHQRWITFGPAVAVVLLSASVISVALAGWIAVLPAALGLLGTVLVLLPRFVTTGPIYDVTIDDDFLTLLTNGEPDTLPIRGATSQLEGDRLTVTAVDGASVVLELSALDEPTRAVLLEDVAYASSTEPLPASPPNASATETQPSEPSELGSCFRAYLEAPGPLTWAAANDAMFAHPDYAPRSMAMNHAEEALEAGELDVALQHLLDDMPNLMMSPNAHLLVGYIAEQQGDAATSELEMTLAMICAQGLLSTGDGSHGRPYTVQRVSDEYDVLRRLNVRPTEQSLVHEEGRSLDVMELEDGTRLHFDITRMFTHPMAPA